MGGCPLRFLPAGRQQVRGSSTRRVRQPHPRNVPAAWIGSCTHWRWSCQDGSISEQGVRDYRNPAVRSVEERPQPAGSPVGSRRQRRKVIWRSSHWTRGGRSDQSQQFHARGELDLQVLSCLTLTQN